MLECVIFFFIINKLKCVFFFFIINNEDICFFYWLFGILCCVLFLKVGFVEVMCVRCMVVIDLSLFLIYGSDLFGSSLMI